MGNGSHLDRSRVVAAVLALSLVLAACSSDGSDGAKATGSTRTTMTPDRASTTTVPPGDDSGVRTERLGAQPDGEAQPPLHLDTEEVEQVATTNLRRGLRSIRSTAAAPAKGPVKLNGTTAPGWHTIDRSPPKSSGGKGSSDSYPGGRAASTTSTTTR
ncbi:hypothetical protein KSP35_02955 [Aquihabitans sp. G128]|uniref:hypothetical protein n=1 Tax=Aquihabitans sp. G128 TaxID=2849779 RepID=UPI001C236C51|nr:hypothetical protein [Aquihabitans sp. G128]QXC61812.1 hypothetical protein KSP35_02955 [Aquihabitans sp. G128]